MAVAFYNNIYYQLQQKGACQPEKSNQLVTDIETTILHNKRHTNDNRRLKTQTHNWNTLFSSNPQQASLTCTQISKEPSQCKKPDRDYHAECSVRKQSIISTPKTLAYNDFNLKYFLYKPEYQIKHKENYLRIKCFSLSRCNM